MKYKLSKSAWESIGKQAGWMGIPDDVSLNLNYSVGKESTVCPKCGNINEVKRNKSGDYYGECSSCGNKWNIE